MIDVQHVSKSFGPVVALADVSLHVPRGARIALVGSNGSGKTTLIRAMAGLLRFDGRIAVGGVDVSTDPEHALRSLAYIPQIAPPIDASVREIARAFAALRRIETVAIAARAARLGLDLEAVAKKRFRDLSGGTKQKVLAAMALATEAEVLVCDEPTANLDAEARAAFFAEVDARPEGRVVVLSSHRADEVSRMVSRVVEMADGKIVGELDVGATVSALPLPSRAARGAHLAVV